MQLKLMVWCALERQHKTHANSRIIDYKYTHQNTEETFKKHESQQ